MKVIRPTPPVGHYVDGVNAIRCDACMRRAPCFCSVHPRRINMRLFDDDKVGLYLDDIGHRVEKTKDGKELRMVDLTLRLQPLTAELAGALDADIRALLFTMTDAMPKGKIKAIHFNLPVPRQALTVYALPEGEVSGALHIPDVDISGVRARTEKGVDGYALIFDASFGPVSARDLEYVVGWHTTQRFVTFQPQEPALDFAGAPEPATSKGPRRVAKAAADVDAPAAEAHA